MRRVDRFAVLGIVGTAAALILGEAGRWHWTLELLSHFRVQYALAFAVATIYFLARRRWLPLLAAASLLLVAAWPIVPYYGLSTAIAGDRVPRLSLRAMSLNLYAGNASPGLAVAAIKQADPDILLLIENNGGWWRELSEIRAKYPYLLADGNPASSDILLFSRRPLGDAQFVHLGNHGWPVAIARVCQDIAAADSGCVDVVGLHPNAPTSEWLAQARDSVLHDLPSALAARGTGPKVVMGDFNCTPWSPRFRDFLTATGLTDSARGHGVNPTWFSRLLPFGLKIDHILIGGGLSVVSYGVGDEVGSDHFAVMAELTL